MPWVWDAEKDRANRRKHGLSFETAQLVFEDPFALSRLDASSREEERWQTVGMVESVVEPVGRIISARKATVRERKAYEEGDL
jgi:uncharacterized DUF497 family protein